MDRVQYCALQFVPAASFSHSNLWSGPEVLGRFQVNPGLLRQCENQIKTRGSELGYCPMQSDRCTFISEAPLAQLGDETMALGETQT